VFDTGVQVEQDDFVPAQQQVRDQRAQHGAFRADAPGAAHLDGSQFEQPNTAVLHRELIRQVVDARVEFEIAASGGAPVRS
jgi:hypothetical protein